MNPDTTQKQTVASSGSRRRSSGLMPAFDGLHQQKRNGYSAAARRESLSDQAVKGGIFNQMFHNSFGRNAGL